jgi:hypothetical protein
MTAMTTNPRRTAKLINMAGGCVVTAHVLCVVVITTDRFLNWMNGCDYVAMRVNKSNEIGRCSALADEIIYEKILPPSYDIADKARLMRKSMKATCSRVPNGICLDDRIID